MTYKPYKPRRHPGFGPVRAGLDIQLPPRNQESSASFARRLRLSVTNSRMRRFRAVPVARRAWYVTLTSFRMQETDFASMQLVHGLPFESQAFWLHSRRLARHLLTIDARSGGAGTMFAVEYRRCCVCDRVLLAAEAQHYRLKMRRPFWRWEFADGPACGVECQPIKRRQQSNAA